MPIIVDISGMDATGITTDEARRLGRELERFDDLMGTRRHAIVAHQTTLFGLARAAQSAMDPDGERSFVSRSLPEAVAWLEADT